MPNKISPKITALIFAMLSVCFLAGFYVSAWTEPSASPPGGLVSAPINVSSVSQTKYGTFNATFFGDANNFSYFLDPSVYSNISTLQINPNGTLAVASAGTGLQIVSDAKTALILRKNSNVGSVSLFIAIGTSSSRSGTYVCQLVSANSVCLGYWTSTGAIAGGTAPGCSSSIANGRALCAGFIN